MWQDASARPSNTDQAIRPGTAPLLFSWFGVLNFIRGSCAACHCQQYISLVERHQNHQSIDFGRKLEDPEPRGQHVRREVRTHLVFTSLKPYTGCRCVVEFVPPQAPPVPERLHPRPVFTQRRQSSGSPLVTIVVTMVPSKIETPRSTQHEGTRASEPWSWAPAKSSLREVVVRVFLCNHGLHCAKDSTTRQLECQPASLGAPFP